MFLIDARTVRQMTFADVQSSAHGLIAKMPIQSCISCDSAPPFQGRSCEANCRDGRSPAPIAARRSTTGLNVIVAIHSINIMTQHFVVRSCQTMMQNAASKPEHLRWNLPAFC